MPTVPLLLSAAVGEQQTRRALAVRCWLRLPQRPSRRLAVILQWNTSSCNFLLAQGLLSHKNMGRRARRGAAAVRPPSI
jgi:hypothetical protein